MRIIGPPYYKPESSTLDEKTCRILHEMRLREARRHRLKDARRKREARLVCPECGDSLKVSLKGRWVCQHCLGPMILPRQRVVFRAL